VTKSSRYNSAKKGKKQHKKLFDNQTAFTGMQKSNGNYADSHLVTSSFLESFTELTCMAGLLTYPRSEQPSHPSRQE